MRVLQHVIMHNHPSGANKRNRITATKTPRTRKTLLIWLIDKIRRYKRSIEPEYASTGFKILKAHQSKDPPAIIYRET